MFIRPFLKKFLEFFGTMPTLGILNYRKSGA